MVENRRAPPRAEQAFNDYLAMGPSRDLRALAARYANDTNPPTKRLRTLGEWSSVFSWQARIAGLLIQEREAIERRHAEERRSIFETGLGLDYQRVKVLKFQAGRQEELLNRLTDRLLERTRTTSDWVEGSGPSRLAHAFRMAHDAYMTTLEAIRKETGADKPIDATELIRQRAERAGVDPDAAVARAVELLKEVTGARR